MLIKLGAMEMPLWPIAAMVDILLAYLFCNLGCPVAPMASF
jgi:hypothetical protein